MKFLFKLNQNQKYYLHYLIISIILCAAIFANEFHLPQKYVIHIINFHFILILNYKIIFFIIKNVRNRRNACEYEEEVNAKKYEETGKGIKDYQKFFNSYDFDTSVRSYHSQDSDNLDLQEQNMEHFYQQQ